MFLLKSITLAVLRPPFQMVEPKTLNVFLSGIKKKILVPAVEAVLERLCADI